MADTPSYDALKAALAREKIARQEAENLLESKSRALYDANQELLKHQDRLQLLVDERTTDLHDKIAELEMLRDSLQRDRDNAQAESDAKTLLFAKLSHEIRTPLNGIIGTLSLIAETPDKAEKTRLRDIALTSSRALKGILNNVIDFAKLEQGIAELEQSPFSPRALLEDIVDLHRMVSLHGAQNLSLSVTGELPSLVMGDAGRIRQILENYINNAVKYGGEGPICLSAGSDLKGRKAVLTFTVTDAGDPIDLDRATYLFAPYAQRPDHRDSKVGTGAGLGLAICKELADLMDGMVWCTPLEDGGNQFSLQVTLPIERRQQKPASDTPHPYPTGDEPLTLEGTPLVLVVEDIPTNQLVMSRYLETIGCQVEIAANGREALNIAALTKFDLVVMDIAMPEMDGFEATEHLRRMDGYQTVPIIGVSAHADATSRREMLSAGMDEGLAKPIDRRAFEACVKRHLVRRAPRPATPPEIFDEADIMKQFQSDLAGAVSELQTAHSDSDEARMKSSLHKMKSLMGTFGHPLYQTVRGLHDGSLAMTADAIGTLLSDLER